MKKELILLEEICEGFYQLEKNNTDEFNTNVYVRYAGRLEALIKMIGIYGLDKTLEMYQESKEVI